MRRLITICMILFVPYLATAQVELKVFYNTDQQDVYSTSDVRSLVFGADKLSVNHIDGAVEYTFAAFDSLMLDETPPVLSAVTSGTIESGADVSATSDKDGTIYLVPDATTATVTDFQAAVNGSTAVSAEATSGTAVVLSTTGLADGDYIVYAVDGGDRISDPSDVITVVTYYPPVLSNVTTGTIEPGDDVTATSDKDGTIYLVPEGTNAVVADFESAVTGGTGISVAATANTAVTISTSGLADGNYLVYAVDDGERISEPSDVITLVTYYAPVLTGVTTGTIEPGEDVTATSDKDGAIYLVPEGTNAAVADFEAAVTGGNGISVAATANTAVTISTSGLADGNYVVFAVDTEGGISDPSGTIELLTTGMEVSPAVTVRIYPNPVKDFLYFDSNADVQEIVVIDLLGQVRIRMENSVDVSAINTSKLEEGIYFMKLSNTEGSATYKFIKK